LLQKTDFRGLTPGGVGHGGRENIFVVVGCGDGDDGIRNTIFRCFEGTQA
jgi:hypothetical protein